MDEKEQDFSDSERWIRKAVEGISVGPVLDVGTGGGACLSALRSRGIFTVGMDISLSSLRGKRNVVQADSHDLVRQGKVRYIGCSKFAPSRLVEALYLSDRFGWTRFVSEQPPYNLLDRRIENELVYVCLRHGVGIIPWAPLATGILSGRYRKGQAPPSGSRASHGGIGPTRLNDAALDVVEALPSLAQAKGVTMAQFSLAWIIHQPGITAPIIGCRTMDHLTSALEVLDIEWTEDDRAQVDALIPPGSAVSDYYDSNVYQSLRAEVGLKQR